MTEGGRSTTYDERADISRRLDSLEADLNRFRSDCSEKRDCMITDRLDMVMLRCWHWNECSEGGSCVVD